MEHIVFLDRETMGPDIELAIPSVEHEWVSYARTAPDQVVERLKTATVAVTNKVPVRERDLAALPRLRLIAVAATGVDNIDVEACRARGIIVSNVRGYARRSVPEHVFALIFALRRNLLAYRQDVLDGEWERRQQFCFFAEPIRDLAGSTLGIIGSGTLGQAVATLGRALGMRCLFAAHKGASSPGALYTGFDEVLAGSDVVTLHCPLNEQTRGLIGARELALMADRRAIIINTARGGVIDESALASALENDRLGGAGIDCVEGEPPPADSPIHRIKHRRNVIVTPHVGWASQSAREIMWAQLIECIEAGVRGEPRNDVTRE